MTTEREPELRECPFCGSEAEMERRGTARASMIIGCTNCGCRMESGDVVGFTEPKGYDWNRRFSGRKIAELRAALEAVDRWLPASPAQHDQMVIANKVRKALAAK